MNIAESFPLWPPCERPIPLVKGKCPEGTKGIGLGGTGAARDGRIPTTGKLSWKRNPSVIACGDASPLSQGGHSGKDSAMFTKNSSRRHDSAAIIRYSIRVPRKKSRYFSYYSLSFTNTHRQTALTTSPVRAVCRFVVIARERFKAIWKNSLQHGHGQSG